MTAVNSFNDGIYTSSLIIIQYSVYHDIIKVFN